jgi:hypothetical protein
MKTHPMLVDCETLLSKCPYYKAIYKFNAIPTKIAMAFYRNRKNSKIYGTTKDPK